MYQSIHYIRCETFSSQWKLTEQQDINVFSYKI